MHPDHIPRQHTPSCSHQAPAPSNQSRHLLGRPTDTARACMLGVFKGSKSGPSCNGCISGIKIWHNRGEVACFGFLRKGTKIEPFMQRVHSLGQPSAQKRQCSMYWFVCWKGTKIGFDALPSWDVQIVERPVTHERCRSACCKF